MHCHMTLRLSNLWLSKMTSLKSIALIPDQGDWTPFNKAAVVNLTDCVIFSHNTICVITQLKQLLRHYEYDNTRFELLFWFSPVSAVWVQPSAATMPTDSNPICRSSPWLTTLIPANGTKLANGVHWKPLLTALLPELNFSAFLPISFRASLI